MRDFSTASKSEAKTSHSKVRFSVQLILLSERPSRYSNDQVFIENELEKLTADGEEVVSILRDHGDLMVILAVPAKEGGI